MCCSGSRKHTLTSVSLVTSLLDITSVSGTTSLAEEAERVSFDSLFFQYLISFSLALASFSSREGGGGDTVGDVETPASGTSSLAGKEGGKEGGGGGPVGGEGTGRREEAEGEGGKTAGEGGGNGKKSGGGRDITVSQREASSAFRILTCSVRDWL